MRVRLTERERTYLEFLVGHECEYAYCNCCPKYAEGKEAAALRAKWKEGLLVKLAPQSTDDDIRDYYADSGDESRDLSCVVTSLRRYAARWNRRNGVKAAIKLLDRLLESVRYVGD